MKFSVRFQFAFTQFAGDFHESFLRNRCQHLKHSAVVESRFPAEASHPSLGANPIFFVWGGDENLVPRGGGDRYASSIFLPLL